MGWYSLAAEQGVPEAQMRLGVAYSIGDGVPKSHLKAMKWCRLAAQAEIEGAQDMMEKLSHLDSVEALTDYEDFDF